MRTLKFALSALLIVSFGSICFGQQTAVLTDQDGIVWTSAKWSASLLSPNGLPTINGIPLTQAQQFAQGITNSSGALSATLTPNNTIDQSGTTWQFTITPNAPNGVSVIPVTITSTTQSLTTVLSNSLVEPRFPASATAFGYADIEVTSAQLGSQYFNVTIPTLRQFNQAGWTSVSGGGGGGVASVNATGNAVVSATVTNPTTTPVVVLTLTSAPANTVLSNSTGSTAAPTYTTTPAFTGSSITGLNFTQLGGAATIAQLPATTVNAAGTVSANTVLKWVTSNTATNSSLADSGTAITTTEPITASAFNGVASGLTAFPIGNFSAAGRVSPITTGLLTEFHINEASGATVAIDYSGNGNNGTYVGTPTLSGGLPGGMIAAGAGYLSFPAADNTALTFSTYTCSAALSTDGSTFPTLIGGLQTATAPSNSNLQAFGVMMRGNNATSIPGNPGRYDTTFTTFNSGSLLTIGAQTADGCHLLTWVRGTTKDQFYIDGSEVTGYFAQPAGSSAVTIASGTFALGMAPYATLPTVAYSYPYPIYYSAVFSTALTATQIQNLAGSVATYAQLRGITKVPAGFSDPGNQLLFVGDSITFGLSTTTPWVRTVTTPGATTIPYIQITGVAGVTNSIASPSWTLGEMLQECTSRGYGAMNPNSATTVIIWGGTNDVATAPLVSAATAYNRLRRLVQCYKAAPTTPRVFVMTMISRTLTGFGGATNDSLKNTLNDLMRRDYAGADGVIDVASFPGLGADGSNANPTAACNGANCFNADHVHPIDAGATIISTGFEGYINWADARYNWMNPILITTGATYQEVAGDAAVNTNPVAAQTITLPAIMSGAAPSFLVGTDRYVNNISAFPVTINPAAGEVIDNLAAGVGITCATLTKCKFRAVLGATPGTATADSLAGAHWEQQ